MGKAIILENISFAQTNLGQITFIKDTHAFKITALENITVSFTNDLMYNKKKYGSKQL